MTKRAARYGTKHDKARAQIQTQLNRGAIIRCSCARPECTHPYPAQLPLTQCGTLIDRFTLWDLGHDDQGLGYRGPECRPCNRAAGARAARGLTSTVIVDRW